MSKGLASLSFLYENILHDRDQFFQFTHCVDVCLGQVAWRRQKILGPPQLELLLYFVVIIVELMGEMSINQCILFLV